MSVIKTIKGTLQNVQHDISNGFKALSERDSNAKVKGHSTHGRTNLDAGASILDKFQHQWSELHNAAEVNAKKAELIDCSVTDLFLKFERENSAITHFLDEVVMLPEIVHHVERSVQLLTDLEVKFSELDKAFVELVDIRDQHRWQKNRHHHEQQLGLYKERRALELEQIKVQAAKEHAVKVENYEAKLQRLLREKQQSFEKTYKDEMDHYKLFGQTQLKPSAMSNDTDLADVSLEQDRTALDDFLKSDELSPADEDLHQGHMTEDAAQCENLHQGHKIENAAQHEDVLQGHKTEDAAQHEDVLQGHKTEDAAQHEDVLQGHKTEDAAQHKDVLQGHKTEDAAQHEDVLQGHKTEDAAQHKNVLQGHKTEDAAQHEDVHQSHVTEDAAQHNEGSRENCDSSSRDEQTGSCMLHTEMADSIT